MTKPKRTTTRVPLSRLLFLALAVGCLWQAASPAAHAQTVRSLRLEVAEYLKEAEGREKNPDSPEMRNLRAKVEEFNTLAENDPPDMPALRKAVGEVKRAADAVTRKARDAGGERQEAAPVRNNAAQPPPAPEQKPPADAGRGDDSGGIEDYLPSLYSLMIAALSLLAIAALAAAGWFVFRLNRRVGELERRHNRAVQKLVVFEKTLGEQDVYAQSVNSGVVRMREEMTREMEELRRSYRDMRTGARATAAAAVAPDQFARAERAPARDPGPTFPALVSDYLSKVSDSKKVEVEADFRTNLFVPAPGGPFVLVQDDDGTGSGIVLPKSRLQKGQEFVSYYKGTYYCDSPSAGEVFVVEPAVVDHAGGGWRLRSPGRLELK